MSDPGSGSGRLPAPGVRLGPYMLGEQLGQGGMGTVFRARDTRLGRDVAIKVLREDRRTPNSAGRFEREIESASRVRHPNLVAVHATGEERGVRYLVSDYVPGVPLDALLKKSGPISTQRAAAIGRKIALALEAIHRAGIVHRDVKPSNIIIAEDGEPLLTDFGVAKVDDTRALTRTHEMIGSPQYAPLEQLEAKEIDGRADIYGLGVTLYEAVTGRSPFSGTDLVAVISEKTKDVQPPTARTSAPDPAFDEICLRCLRRDPLERYASARDLAQALELHAKGAYRPKAHGGRRAARVVATAAAIFAGLLSLFVTFVMVPSAAGDPAQGLLELVHARRARTPSLHALDLADVASRLALLEGTDAATTRAALETRTWVGLAALAHGDAALAERCAAPLGSSTAPAALALRGALALARRADARRASVDLDRAALSGLELPELDLWRLQATFRRASNPAMIAPEVLDGLTALRARFETGRDGAILELECLIALKRSADAKRRLSTLDPQPPELAWAILMIGVDLELTRTAPLGALAVLGDAVRPPGPLDTDDRRRLDLLQRFIVKHVLPMTSGTSVSDHESDLVCAALRLHARLAPGETLPGPIKEVLRDAVSNPAVAGMKDLALAAGELAEASDELLDRAISRVLVTNDTNVAARVEALARRLVAQAPTTARRLEGRAFAVRALILGHRWEQAQEEARAALSALSVARAAAEIEPGPANEIEAQLLFSASIAVRFQGRFEEALTLQDRSVRMGRVPPDAWLMERMIVLDALKRNGEGLDAALEMFEQPPIVGQYRKPLLEMTWQHGLKLGRLAELGRVFDTVEQWRLELEPVWEVRRALFLAARKEWGRASGVLSAARVHRVVADRVTKELVVSLGRGDRNAVRDLEVVERELTPAWQR